MGEQQTDIVKQLRNPKVKVEDEYGGKFKYCTNEECREAAAEITRLREEWKIQNTAIADQHDEIRRLRERLAIAERALEEIQYEDTKIYTRRPCGKIAQDALDQMKGGE